MEIDSWLSICSFLKIGNTLPAICLRENKMCRLVYSLILKGSFHLMFDYIPEEKKTNKQKD